MEDRNNWRKSDHYDGAHFHNPIPRREGFVSLLRWLATRKPGYWPETTSNTYAAAPPACVGDLRITFVGHTTFLIQMSGLNILTDPIWSMRASPVSWAGPRRRAMPGIRFEDLPAIDVVVISHDHYDHMDMPTIERLAHEHNPLFISGLGNDRRLAGAGIERVLALDWWQTHEFRPEFQITAAPARHFSGRTPFDRNSTLWCGFVLEGPAGRVYFAGDTAFGDHFSQVAERFDPIRAALLPIGAFRPEWFMGAVHCTPLEAFEAHRILDPRVSVATHFGTFPLADDGQIEPVAKLQEIVQHSDLNGSAFWVMQFGEGRNVPKL